LKEKVALKVSTINRCDYCVKAHTMVLQRLGVPEQEIKLIAEPSRLPEGERICLQYAEKVTRDPNGISDDEFTQLRRHFSEAQIVEITAVIGLFNFLNRFLDALRIPFG